MVYDEDEWKHARHPNSVGPAPKITRAQEQARIDVLYGQGKMDRDMWRAKTDALSDSSKWDANGPITINIPVT